MTPQIFYDARKAVEEGTRLSDVALLVLDEAHDVKGGHVYAKLMEMWRGELAHSMQGRYDFTV